MSEPLVVTEVVPATLTSFDLATPEGKEQLRARYGRTDASYLRVNMITSVTGAAVGADGTSETLTNRVDRSILGAIRRDADLVLVGAQTVRAEGYVVPRDAHLAVVTASGDLSGHRLHLDEHAERVLVVCPADRVAAVRARLGSDRIPVLPVHSAGGMRSADILGALVERGHRRIVCEGGPTLASGFARAGLIDEYCLTVAPVLEPAEHPFLRLTSDERPTTDVAGMLVDASGFSYLRLRARLR